MRTYKSKIIKKYGTDVKVKRFLDDMTFNELDTKVLLGRGSRTNTNLKMFENQKECIFLPDFDVKGGDFVHNSIHGEDYVVVATHQEYDGNKKLSTVTNVMKCSHVLNVKGHTRVADSRGNVKSSFGTKYDNVPCYVHHVTSQLRQYEPGLNPDTEHLIYTTDLNLSETDQLVVTVSGKDNVFRVVATDYLTFSGLVVIEVKGDIRK